jgi:uncharacterized protein
MIIDSHSHVMLPAENQINIMKKAGIDKSILFPTMVHPEKAGNRMEFENEINQLNKVIRGEINPIEARLTAINELLRTLNDYDFYLGGFGGCPIGQDLKTTSDWIQNNIIGNGLKGIGELTIASGSVNMIENIFKSLTEYKQKFPVWIHTFNPLNLNDIMEITEMAKKYPSVLVIMGHSGGSFWLETIQLVKEINNIYVDVSIPITGFAIKLMSQEFPERILFGSDMPYGNPIITRQLIEFEIDDKYIREMVLGNNILKIIE